MRASLRLTPQVQMRAGDTAGHADFTEDLATIECLPGCDINLAHMAVHGDQSLAVVKQYGIAIEKEVAGIEYGAGRRGMNRGAFRGRQCPVHCAGYVPVH